MSIHDLTFTGDYSDLDNLPSIPAPQQQSDWAAVSGVTAIANKPMIPAAQVQSDWSAVSGAAAILNKPTIPTVPTVKRMETFNQTTDANGLITVAYSPTYPATPNVQPGPPPSSDMSWVLVSSTAAGFSIRLVQRAVLTVLSLQVLAGTVTSVAGTSAKVLVVES